ncbi:MAG: glycosyltransferase family 2 protein [Candidatus Nealsonbacteria bacterium]|nr:glycosyltransferase family 2 protein [Candidatus Nealsonbacteria bacterium]
MFSATVIVVAYHADRWMPRCVETLREAFQEHSHLVLVDNGGTSRMEGLPLTEFDHLILPTSGPLGFAEANNFALQQVGLTRKAVCFLNQDTLSTAGWLAACLACLRDHPEVGAVSPLIRTYDGTDWDPAFRDCAKKSLGLLERLDNEQEVPSFCEVPMITAAAMVVRSDVLREVGPFDPIFRSYYEDYDLCRRIRLAGWRVGICTQGRIAHYSGSATFSEKAQRRRIRWIVRNRAIHQIRLADRHRLRAMLRYLTCNFARNLCRSVWHTPSSQPLREFLGAHLDLLPLLGRLVSEKRDLRSWKRYLDELNWMALPSGPFRGHNSND